MVYKFVYEKPKGKGCSNEDLNYEKNRSNGEKSGSEFVRFSTEDDRETDLPSPRSCSTPHYTPHPSTVEERTNFNTDFRPVLPIVLSIHWLQWATQAAHSCFDCVISVRISKIGYLANESVTGYSRFLAICQTDSVYFPSIREARKEIAGCILGHWLTVEVTGAEWCTFVILPYACTVL